MSKYILHYERYDNCEVFDEEPTSEEIDSFLTNSGENSDNIVVYEVKKIGGIKKKLSIVFDDKCKDC